MHGGSFHRPLHEFGTKKLLHCHIQYPKCLQRGSSQTLTCRAPHLGWMWGPAPAPSSWKKPLQASSLQEPCFLGMPLSTKWELARSAHPSFHQFLHSSQLLVMLSLHIVDLHILCSRVHEQVVSVSPRQSSRHSIAHTCWQMHLFSLADICFDQHFQFHVHLLTICMHKELKALVTQQPWVLHKCPLCLLVFALVIAICSCHSCSVTVMDKSNKAVSLLPTNCAICLCWKMA